jgi:hypothetical protein
MTAAAVEIPTLSGAALLHSAITRALRCEPLPEEFLVIDCSSTNYRRVAERRSATSRSMGVSQATHGGRASGHA